jgi:DNA-binding MarR family transcriptional regulator
VARFSNSSEPGDHYDISADLPYSTEDPEHRLALAFRDVRRSWPAWYSYNYGSEGSLDSGQYDVLWHVTVAAPSGCRMGDIAAALRIDSSTATRAVDRLVSQGFVRRIQSADDRRVFLAQATPSGRKLVIQMSTEATQRWRSVLHKALGEGEIILLAEWLQRLTAVYDEALEDEDL